MINFSGAVNKIKIKKKNKQMGCISTSTKSTTITPVTVSTVSVKIVGKPQKVRIHRYLDQATPDKLTASDSDSDNAT